MRVRTLTHTCTHTNKTQTKKTSGEKKLNHKQCLEQNLEVCELRTGAGLDTIEGPRLIGSAGIGCLEKSNAPVFTAEGFVIIRWPDDIGGNPGIMDLPSLFCNAALAMASTAILLAFSCCLCC